LKTMGGKASGPEPLRSLLEFARERILRRQGRRLRGIDAHDIICKIGECVVAGGVRRTAMISLSDLDDTDLRDAKKGQFFLTEPYRSVANNSAVYESKPSNTELIEEWAALMKSGSGERGIFNRGALLNTLPKRRAAYFKKRGFIGEDGVVTGPIGTNPCVTADTWVHTDSGARQVRNLVGAPFVALVNGRPHASDGFFETGTKPIFEVRADRGFFFTATANHRVLTVSYQSRKIRRTGWKQVGDLAVGDRIVLHDHRGASWNGRGNHREGWLLGSLLGDGNVEKNGTVHLDYWGAHRETMLRHAVRLIHETVSARADAVGHSAKTGYARASSVGLGTFARSFGMRYDHKVVTDDIEESSSNFYEGFLQGWFDADGSIQGTQRKGVSIRLSSSTLSSLVRAQRMLARLGIIGTLYTNRRAAGNRRLPNGRGGLAEYFCEAQHELVISNDNVMTFAVRIGFVDPEKRARLFKALGAYRRAYNRERVSVPISSITPMGEQPVYDCSVPGPHAFDGNGIYLHNCGEILLQSKQFCNLSEVIARAGDTHETLIRKTRLAALLGTYQSTLTNFTYISKDWKKHCDEER
ncbi:MAG: LAGLIDADG family homing endonuclease, partial [Patescibacteria group bacterium]